MTVCAICSSPVREILDLGGDKNVTSLGQIAEVKAKVYLCNSCAHAQTDFAMDLGSYYATEYKVLGDSAEEDDLYAMRDGVPLYRNAHMAALLAQRFGAMEGDILDFGCGKSLLMKHFAEKTKRDSIYLFDVSTDYLQFWDSFVPRSHTACNVIPEVWTGKFQLVTAAFSFEHLPKPLDTLQQIVKLLRRGGFLYLVIPNMYSENAADMLVVDHVQHFSEPSMRYLLEKGGLDVVSVDNHSHAQASIYVAQAHGRSDKSAADSALIAQTVAKCEQIASQWKRAKEEIQRFEAGLEQRGIRTYYIAGAGVIGTYVYLQLRNPERVAGFIDSSSFKQGKGWQGLPVLPPSKVKGTSNIAIWVGLNLRQVDSIAPALIPQGTPPDNVWTIRSAFTR